MAATRKNTFLTSLNKAKQPLVIAGLSIWITGCDEYAFTKQGANSDDGGLLDISFFAATAEDPQPMPTGVLREDDPEEEPNPEPTVIASPTPSASPSVTPTVVPSPKPTVQPSPTPSVTVSPTPKPSPTVTASPSPSPTVTVKPSPTPTVNASPSPSPTVTASPSPSPTVTVKPSPTPTVTASPSPSPTVTASPSPSPTVTVKPSPTPTVTPSPTPSVTPVACYEDTFHQNQPRANKVDLLFVQDTSASLDSQRNSIAAGIDKFLNELPADVNVRIGVLLAHGSRSAYAGRLYSYGSAPKVLDTTTMSRIDVRKHLKDNLTRVPSDRASDGGEEMLYAMTKATKPGSAELAQSKGLGFFREDAALASIVITDENDLCYPGKIKDVDGDLEAVAYKTDCPGITANSVYNQVKALKGEKPLLIGGIYYNNMMTAGKGTEQEFGYGVDELVRLANGPSIDLAGSFVQGLATIGQFMAAKLELITEFKLTMFSGVDSSSIQVTVDGQEVPFTYEPSTGEILLSADKAGGAGSEIEVKYCKAPN